MVPHVEDRLRSGADSLGEWQPVGAGMRGFVLQRRSGGKSEDVDGAGSE
jgi:hypothetical protein